MESIAAPNNTILSSLTALFPHPPHGLLPTGEVMRLRTDQSPTDCPGLMPGTGMENLAGRRPSMFTGSMVPPQAQLCGLSALSALLVLRLTAAA